MQTEQAMLSGLLFQE